MYYYLTQQIHREFVGELRKYWSFHPKYKDLVDHIQGKYSFRERPQYGIIIKNSSGNQVQLAADNFVGHTHSYLYKADVNGYPNLSIEWVRENAVAIQNNNGVFPSLPGIYYIDFCDANGNPTDKAFYIDPLLNIVDETLLQVDALDYQISLCSFVPGTRNLFQLHSKLNLYDGAN